MKRYLCLLLSILCLLGCAAPSLAAEVDESADYTTAGKLLKQLWAGSGFSGTLTLELLPVEGTSGQALTTHKPLSVDVDYIYVRPTDSAAASHRLDMRLMDNETEQTAAHVSLDDGALSVQADLIGADWYALSSAGGVRPQDAQAAMQAGTQAPEAVASLDDETAQLLERTGMPALARYLLPLAVKTQEHSETLKDVADAYSMRIDLWIEGYRQNATLGKLEDGTTTMTTQYTVPPAAIKAQVKQMVLDVLGDTVTLSKLQALVGASDAAILLDPRLQGYYFQAIDDLPLPGDMTVERTVTLAGDTTALRIALPMYDAEGGTLTMRYTRERGESDQPDQNVVALEAEDRAVTLRYQHYTSAEGVNVWQGTLASELTSTAGFAVGEDESEPAQKALAVDFTLTLQKTEGRDEEARDFCDYDLKLTLAPDEASAGTEAVEFPETEIALTAHFVSKTLKTAATEMEATLTVGGTERASTLKATLAGKSRKKWTPDPLPQTLVSAADMTAADWSALLPGVITRGGALMLQYFNLPAEDAGADGAADTDAQGAEPTATPEVFQTLAPGATIAP